MKEVLDCYNVNYIKLPESKKSNVKVPDWRIETDKYIFLVEQKTTLFPIDTRTITKEEGYQKLEDFFDKVLIKAFRQLNAYSVEKTDKPVIRICLTFEKIYMEENVMRIIKPKLSFVKDIALNWIVNIDEFEVLMYLLNSDVDKFNEVIQNKIDLNVAQDNNGRTLEKLLAGCKYDYTSEKIDYFDNIQNYFALKLKDM